MPVNPAPHGGQKRHVADDLVLRPKRSIMSLILKTMKKNNSMISTFYLTVYLCLNSVFMLPTAFHFHNKIKPKKKVESRQRISVILGKLSSECCFKWKQCGKSK